MKRLAVILLLFLTLPLAGQQYEVPEITVSKDKVRVDGESYYAHVVTAKQTLYSISRVYGVSLQEIYDANKNLELEKNGLKIGQVLLIPTVPSVKAEPETLQQPQADEQVQAGSAQDDRSLFPQFRELLKGLLGQEDSTFVADIPEVIKVAVLLPFGANGIADGKSVDFYSGMLLAARDLGNKGIKLEIDTHDISSGKLTYSMLSGADIILGPISAGDVYMAARIAPSGKYIISPLEPKTAKMADSLRIIQAPTPAATQAKDAVNWAISEMAPGDSLVLIREKGKPLSENSAAIVQALKESGTRYATITYDLLSGLQIQPMFVDKSSAKGVTRYLIASEDESFVNDAVRNINLMAYKKQAVALYGPSKLRSYGTIETENLHNVSCHISTTYQIDYTRADVQAFIMAYRALFGAEPNQFAFHGYDCLSYFVNMCAHYGRGWSRKLSAESGHGLQADFSFGDASGKGLVNSAVRRIIYTPGFEIVLL